MKNIPRVSIFLPVFNGGATIGRRLDAALKQSYTDFRLFILDNASTDNTEAICRKYVAEDPRLHYHRNRINLGLGSSMQRGIYLGSGSDFIVYAPHGDYWAPDYLESCVAALDAHPEASLAYTYCQFFDVNGNYTRQMEDDFDLTGLDAVARLGCIISQLGLCTAFYGVLRLNLVEEYLWCLRVGSAGNDNLLLAAMALNGPFIQIKKYLYFREEPLVFTETAEERASRLGRMGAGDMMDKYVITKMGWPFLQLITCHCPILLSRKKWFTDEVFDDFFKKTIDALMSRYGAHVRQEMAYHIDAAVNPQQGEQRAYKTLEYFNSKAELTMLTVAQFMGFYIEGFHLARGILLSKIGNHYEARGACEQELKHNPTSLKARELKAQLDKVLNENH